MNPTTHPHLHTSYSEAPEAGTVWEQKVTGERFEVTGDMIGRNGIMVTGIRSSGRRGRITLGGLLVWYWQIRN